jgi:hypothetical protein
MDHDDDVVTRRSDYEIRKGEAYRGKKEGAVK